ncbi:AAA family ATPase [Streptomyces sp. B93]|uniref:AAA family ATPase n=1 Tax=Streptomyces sp. B93 TaxID=2824875 RepID=UPI001B39400F|nr:AAA family ATPase [Streptomyces sp. B93]MBQ1091419.1 AAA family ATPase [Streptomyces sp. B93]
MFSFRLCALNLTDGTVITPPRDGMTIFTGPNNSGKSVLLRELVTSVHVPASPDPKRWLKSVQMHREGGGEEFIEWLAERGIEGKNHPRNNIRYLPDRHPSEEYYTLSVDAASTYWQNGKLGEVGHFLVNDQWTESRLANQTDAPQWEWVRPASHPTQILWESREKMRQFSDLFERAFGVPIVINRYAPNIRLQFGPVGVEDTAPPPSSELMEAYASLPYVNEQGDGVRAFTNLLVHTLIRPAPVIVIDEPEAFLHPPQVRLLAHYLIRYTPAPCQIFVATHSADFLSGALEENAATPGNPTRGLCLVRISRNTGFPVARSLPSESVNEILDTPLLRYSNIVAGIFHDGVVLCEGEGDCQFYAATFDAVRGSSPHENLIFLHVNGKARLSDAAWKLRACGVPVAAIADFDFLNDTKKIKDALSHLGGDWEAVKADVFLIQKEASSEVTATTASEIKKQIISIIGNPRGKTALTDRQVESITEALKTANGWKKMKASGLESLNGESYAAAKRLISYFAELGLFLVPVGELECWVKDIPRSNKMVWLNRVFEEGRHRSPSGELQEFSVGVKEYLTSRGRHLGDAKESRTAEMSDTSI